MQNIDFRSNSKPEEKLSSQFTAVNKEFDFDNAKVAFEKMLCKRSSYQLGVYRKRVEKDLQKREQAAQKKSNNR